MMPDTAQTPPKTDTAIPFDAPLTVLPGIGAKRAENLAKLGLGTVGDLLFYFPRTHQDRRHITPIAALEPGEHATIQGTIISAHARRMSRGLNAAQVKVEDETGQMALTFFGQGYLAQSAFQAGKHCLFSGVVQEYKGLTLNSPSYELLSDDAEDRVHTGRIVPVYALREGVSQRLLRKWIYDALALLHGALVETLPEALLIRRKLPPLAEALPSAHFPETPEAARAALARFAYEELLMLQLAVLADRAARQVDHGIAHRINGPILRGLHDALPFTLTDAQERVIAGLLRDMASPAPMAALLQGDVGSGKTVVALHCLAAALDGGHQVAFMAPTEILVEQHYRSLAPLLAPLGVRVAQLTGAIVGAKSIRKELARGDIQVVFGTHALFQESTSFKRLGLVIIDEQHRFGVLQRNALLGKGMRPDLLHMSATPIPRTLALTLYGGMDVHILDELPPGRKPVKTRRIPDSKVTDLYRYLVTQAEAGRQSYIVCPLIEEGEETRNLKAVVEHYEDLCAGPLASLRVGLLHGRMNSQEKDEVMAAFKAGALDVLVATTVIEVGVDVPNATTLVIENAPQFGLTQLHQLRGRVGRGDAQAYCFLLGKPSTPEGRERLDTLCREADGFAIAEADLQLRGPGEFTGIRQAGLSDLRTADLARDADLLDQARIDAAEILRQATDDPDCPYAALLERARRILLAT